MSSLHAPALPENRSMAELIRELNAIKAQYSAKEQMCRELTEELARIKSMQAENQPASESNTPENGELFLTERKHIEETVAHQRELLQSVFDNIPVMLVVWDPCLKKFTLNRKAETVLGWTTADANDGDFMSKVYPDPVYRNEVAAYMRSLSPEWREWNVATKDGGRVPSTWTNIRLTDETMIGIGVDLSDRKQAEQVLRVTENKFQTALKNSKFIPSQFDLELRYQWIYNYHPDFSLERIIGKRDDELNDSAGSKRLMALKKMVIDKGIGMREEISFFLSDGPCTYDFLIEPLRDSYDVIVGGTSAAFDITDIRQAQNELEQILFRMEWVLDQVGVGTWFNELPLARLIWDNQTKCLFFVSPDEEPVIELFWSRLHPDDREPTRLAVEKAIHDRTTYTMEHRAVNPKTGKIRWIRSVGRATYAEDGSPICFDGINYDITEQKQTEKALRESEEKLLRLNEYLEQQVAERTTLAEERARQLQALAVELIKAEEKERDRTALLLHDDLQQLLASAKMQLQAVRQILPPDNLLFNVQNLLAECISKSRSLSHELKPPILHHSDFGSSLKWLIERMNTQFGLQVEFRSGEVEIVESAPLKIFIFRAVQELLFNIVKHSEVKKAKIDLYYADDILVISVSDQGKGFDPEILMNDKTTIGLGLVSLRERVSYIGGTFLIESSPGQGCRITLTLPDSISGEKSSDDQSANLSKSIIDSEKLKEKKIECFWLMTTKSCVKD
jgi:PAS domain S-box-containing protein